MSWADLYLVCFIVGFALSLISVLGGSLRLPGLHHAHGHHGHVHVGHGHGGGLHVSPINFSTITAFLAWFGAVGYLLTQVFKRLALAGISHRGRRRNPVAARSCFCSSSRFCSPTTKRSTLPTTT